MYHRPSQRQAHTPNPGYNQGYGGYTSPAPPAVGGGGYPGYAAHPPPMRAPPPGADPELWHWFSAVDADRSGSITVTELQSALVNGTVICSSPLVARRSIRRSFICVRAKLIFLISLLCLGNWTSEYKILKSFHTTNRSCWVWLLRPPRVGLRHGTRTGPLTQTKINLPQ
jgi:hypothetical protein